MKREVTLPVIDTPPEQIAAGLLGSRPAPAISVSDIPAVNVASVPQRSPLRYPGGKTWLVPHIRHWLAEPCGVLVEPFAGGGIVSLTAVMEGLAERALMVDLDRDVAAFWRAALMHGDDLAELVLTFDVTRESVTELEQRCPGDVVAHGFRTLVLNRTRRGGVLAPGASLTRSGENGNGIGSRWYPDTLAGRLAAITEHADRLTFCEGDGAAVLEMTADIDGVRMFVDAPYTAGGKRAGSRLYAHNAVDHRRIFETLADAGTDFVMTYDCCDEITELVAEHRFHAVTVEMRNGHNTRVPELVITRDRLFA
ncbi:DNA adenine methylase [Candidatus Poriferisodalis sp.]|uniref:DNA adenine methylase n=1 Tax=Candidatus Poriferisodalis sp. TaxID=3101277 RepID=UPI003B028F04